MSSFGDIDDQNDAIFTNEINFNEIKLLEVVGKGTFGVVRRGHYRGLEVAVKLIETEQERKAFQIELRQLSRVSHPNIVRLYGATVQPVTLVMEYAEGGSLYNVLHSAITVAYTLSHAISWVLQCARGVAYLHAMQPKALIHRDLKPPNLLLVNGGTILKICDFGTACDIHTHMTNNKGSAAWMAPEVFESWNYSEKCDVFSWGIILWEVLARKKPFDEIGGPAFRIMWAVHSGQRPPLLRNCPKVIELLMIKCWAKDPDERPSMSQVEQKVEHIFQFCKDQANEPIVNTHSHGNAYTSHESICSTDYSMDPLMQTQLDAPQQIVTEPPQHNMSATNIESNDFLTKINPAFSVPPNMSGLLMNSGINVGNNSQLMQSIMQNKIPRRSSDIHNQNVASTSTSQLSHRKHKRSSSSGTPITISNNTNNNIGLSQGLSRSIVNLNDDTSVVYASQYNAGPSQLRYSQFPHINVSPISRNRLDIDSVSPRVEPINHEFNAYLVLESKLQPVQPEANSKESIDLFNQHRQLSQEYLKMQMEVTLLMERKHELEKVNNRIISNSLDDYWQLKSEKDGLLQLRDNLIKQMDFIKRKTRQREAAADGDWVLVDQTDTQTSNG